MFNHPNIIILIDVLYDEKNRKRIKYYRKNGIGFWAHGL